MFQPPPLIIKAQELCVEVELSQKHLEDYEVEVVKAHIPVMVLKQLQSVVNLLVDCYPVFLVLSKSSISREEIIKIYQYFLCIDLLGNY
jgi:hypothetical protein